MSTSKVTTVGIRCITYMASIGAPEMENKMTFFFRPDTIEVYQKNQNTLFKIKTFIDSKNNKTTIFHKYFYFQSNAINCLYYYEFRKEDGYRILNKDSVMKVNYSPPISSPVDTNLFLTLLKSSNRTYNDKGFLIKEIIVTPSQNCTNINDSITYYFSTDKARMPISLAPYLDSIRKQPLINYEIFLCAKDTSNPQKYYRIKAKGELQKIGKIKHDDPVNKIFIEMEKQYAKMIQ